MLDYFFFLWSFSKCFIFTLSYLQHNSFWDLQRNVGSLVLSIKSCASVPYFYLFFFFGCGKSTSWKVQVLWVWMAQQDLSICRCTMYEQLKHLMKNRSARRNLHLPPLTPWLKQNNAASNDRLDLWGPTLKGSWSGALGSPFKRDARLMPSKALASPASWDHFSKMQHLQYNYPPTHLLLNVTFI